MSSRVGYRLGFGTHVIEGGVPARVWDSMSSRVGYRLGFGTLVIEGGVPARVWDSCHRSTVAAPPPPSTPLGAEGSLPDCA